MDSIVVAVASAISDETLGAFLKQKGGYRTGGGSGDWGVERGDAVVWISLESRTIDDDTWIDRLNQDKILLTLSHLRVESLFLAFELATELADQWHGTVWCSGVPGWQEQYASWLKAHGRA